MRKGFRILLVGLLLAAAGGIAWLVLHAPAEPVYQGKRLSFWLQSYDHRRPHYDSSWKQTDAALNEAGTNAIPVLLRFLEENDSSFKYRLSHLLEKQHFVKISYTPASILHEEATQAFLILGARASSVAPELIQIYDRNISPESQWAVATSLGCIGSAASNAVPLLLTRASASKAASPTNTDVRDSAICALGKIHAQPAVVVPVLVELLLHSPNSSAQYCAAEALRPFGSDAKLAIPLLIKCYDTQTNENLKADVGFTLKKIDPEAAAKAGVK